MQHCCHWDRYCFLDIVIGAIVGFGSTLTATGGPLIVIPLIFACYPQTPATEAVGLAQIVSIPISICSSVGFGISSKTSIDVGLACTMAAGLLCGIPVGAHVAHKLPQLTLKAVVSAVLVAVGVSVTIQTILRMPQAEGSGANATNLTGDGQTLTGGGRT